MRVGHEERRVRKCRCCGEGRESSLVLNWECSVDLWFLLLQLKDDTGRSFRVKWLYSESPTFVPTRHIT